MRGEIRVVAENEELLKEKMRQKFGEYGLSDFDFEITHAMSIASFFENFNCLKCSKIAKRASIKPWLFRQYVDGTKEIPFYDVKKLNEVIAKIAQELQQISLGAT